MIVWLVVGVVAVFGLGVVGWLVLALRNDLGDPQAEIEMVQQMPDALGKPDGEIFSDEQVMSRRAYRMPLARAASRRGCA